VPFLLLNLLWILTIVLLPFATQVVGSFPPEPLAVLIYICTNPESSACLAAITVHVWRRPTLRGPGPRLRRGRRYYGAMLLLSGPLESWLRRRQRAR
jgi:uncharacterized membrane protein